MVHGFKFRSQVPKSGVTYWRNITFDGFKQKKRKTLSTQNEALYHFLGDMSSSHQSKFPCIIITIIIILLFFSSFSTLLTVNLFVLFWRCFVMLNWYFVCFIIYIFFFYFEIFFVDIIFVPKIGVCFSFYPVSLIFEYEAKPHIRWPHIREYEAGESGANFTSVLNMSSAKWRPFCFGLNELI